MIVQQALIGDLDQVADTCSGLAAIDPDLVLAFGHPRYFGQDFLPSLKRRHFPHAHMLGCSTAGEIYQVGVATGSLVLTAVRFDQRGRWRVAWAELDDGESHHTTQRLGESLAAPDLAAVLLIAPGVAVDGSALIRGLRAGIGPDVSISGGLAGDDDAFRQTFTLCDDRVSNRGVVALGLYGDGFIVRHGCYGGWKPFGTVRQVTRREGNVLLELDGRPALDVYKLYLGTQADGLPATGLLFPFAIVDDETREVGLIRSIIGIDEARGALVFAGDIPDGCRLRLMQASTDTLVDGAQAAAEAAVDGAAGAGLALLVSCVGRRLVMAGRVEEEVEAVADVFGAKTTVAGFYSFGEISPLLGTADCRLHNQTMTITYLAER